MEVIAPDAKALVSAAVVAIIIGAFGCRSRRGLHDNRSRTRSSSSSSSSSIDTLPLLIT